MVSAVTLLGCQIVAVLPPTYVISQGHGGPSSPNMCIWDSSVETEGDTDQCRKGWSAGEGQSLCGGDEGRIKMKNTCLDTATKYRLKDVARE